MNRAAGTRPEWSTATPNYIVVRFAGPRALRGQIVPVRLDTAPTLPADFLPLAMASATAR